MVDDIVKKAKDKMEKTCALLKKDLQSLRAGRANPQILDKVLVPYYGSPTPLKQLANVSVPEARGLQISLYDTKALGDVEKAILKSDIGINPTNDGKVIRLVIPELNEERRKELSKQVRKSGEESKVAVRSVRRDAIEQMKKAGLKQNDLNGVLCMGGPGSFTGLRIGYHQTAETSAKLNIQFYSFIRERVAPVGV